MNRKLLLYGVLLALLAIALKAAEYKLLILDHAMELYMGFLAVLFVTVGVVMGKKLTTPKEVVIEKLVGIPTTPSLPFTLNESVLDQLGISKREHEILMLMAEGMSNQEIAEKSYVSVNTVKTHVSNLLLKLDAKRRTQAVIRARELNIVP